MAIAYFTVTAPEEIVKKIEAAAPLEGVEIGKSRSGNSLTDAVDAPLGPEEIVVILQLISVGFATATAAIAFFDRLKKFLAGADQPKPIQIVITDARSGKKVATIDRHTDSREIATKLVK